MVSGRTLPDRSRRGEVSEAQEEEAGEVAAVLGGGGSLEEGAPFQGGGLKDFFFIAMVK